MKIIKIIVPILFFLWTQAYLSSVRVALARQSEEPIDNECIRCLYQFTTDHPLLILIIGVCVGFFASYLIILIIKLICVLKNFISKLINNNSRDPY